MRATRSLSKKDMKRPGSSAVFGFAFTVVTLLTCTGPGTDFAHFCRRAGGTLQGTCPAGVPGPGLFCACKIVRDGMDETAKMKDENGDGKVQPRGPDGTAGNNDDEVWCENSSGDPIKCRFFPKDRFQSVCEEAEGSWTQEEDGTDVCVHSGEDIAAIASDDDSDGYYDVSEYRCETLDETGGPSGSSTPCPFDEWTD